MNELIEELVLALKEEAVFKRYLKAKKELEKHAELLLAYKKAKEDYLNMRPYFAYQDFSELKARAQDLASQVSHLPAYQEYCQAESSLKERLDELNQVIFQNLSVNTEAISCALLQENIRDEI